MSQPGPGTGGRRRRGAELEAGLLEAAWAELAEVGYAQLSMEGVAARAHTGKQVLYRRWRNRAELVIAAMRHNTWTIADNVPDTGDLRADVQAVLRLMVRRHREVGPDVIHGLLADAHDVHPELFTRMSGVMTTILERATARGELGPALLSPRIVTLAADLVRHEMLLTREPITEQTLTQIVDDVYLPLLYAAAPPPR